MERRFQGSHGPSGEMARHRLRHPQGQPEDIRPFPCRLRHLLLPQERILQPVQGRNGSQSLQEGRAHPEGRGPQGQHRMEEDHRGLHRAPEAVERDRSRVPQEERRPLEAFPCGVRRILRGPRQEFRRCRRHQLLRQSQGQAPDHRRHPRLHSSG